jgi:hypothetical protein
MQSNMFKKRYITKEEVPIYSMPVIPYNHPDLELILSVYKEKGMGVGVDYGIVAHG